MFGFSKVIDLLITSGLTVLLVFILFFVCVDISTHNINKTKKIYAVMGGFHLYASDFDSVVKPTTDALIDINPEFVIPTHCTGRDTVAYIEKTMPKQFILNMSGTKLTFSK